MAHLLAELRLSKSGDLPVRQTSRPHWNKMVLDLGIVDIWPTSPEAQLSCRPPATLLT